MVAESAAGESKLEASTSSCELESHHDAGACADSEYRSNLADIIVSALPVHNLSFTSPSHWNGGHWHG